MLEVKRKDGSLVDFCNDEQVAQLFLDFVPNNVMRSVLFNSKLNVEPKASNLGLDGYGIINVMKRIINTAYVIALCRWKQLRDNKKDWANDEDDVRYFENSRFTKLFQSAVLGEDIALDLQIFSLLELWVDLKKAPPSVSTPFSVIFDPNKTGDRIGAILQASRDAIKNATFKKGNYTGKYTKQYCNELCYMLLRSFMVFRGAKISYPEDNRLDDDRDFAISYMMFFDEIVLYPNTIFATDNATGKPSAKFIASEQQLRIMNGETDVSAPVRLVLYMRTETSAFDGKFQQRYNSFDGERQTYVQTDVINEEPKEANSIRDIHETRKFLSFSYKNIREFAMILNDSIKNSLDKKRELFKICQDKYPKIVADIKDCDAPNIYWDNIITLMLLEMGVSDFLKKILCEGSLFTNVLENIAWRNTGKGNLAELKREHKARLDKIEINRTQNPKAYEELKLELCVKTVLKAMNFGTDDDDDKNAFLESLSYKYSNIVACISRLNKNNDFSTIMSSANELQKIFGDIFMFLQIFYVGLDNYAQKHMELKDSFSTESAGTVTEGGDEDNSDVADKIRKNRLRLRRECHMAFEQAAKAKLDEIKDQSLTQLFDGFCNLCSSYNTFSEEGKFDISEQAKRLKYAITRNYICDSQKLRRFATVVTKSGEETTVFEVLGNLQKYSGDPSFPEWLNYLKDIFMFLIYNEDYNCRGLWNSTGAPLKDKDCDPIYPYIVTYYKENIDRDNVKKCSYRVPLPIAGTENEGYVVTLLTDEEYLPQTYYCIPLRYGSSDSWWINPFLIPKNVIRQIGYPESRKKG